MWRDAGKGETVNPYLRAHAEYVKADRGLSWTDALEWHFQVGAVVGTPEFFVMARPVELVWSDAEHADVRTGPAHADTWHVWAVAGNLLSALALAAAHGVEWVTYQRHGTPRIHRAHVGELLRRQAG